VVVVGVEVVSGLSVVVEAERSVAAGSEVDGEQAARTSTKTTISAIGRSTLTPLRRQTPT